SPGVGARLGGGGPRRRGAPAAAGPPHRAGAPPASRRLGLGLLPRSRRQSGPDPLAAGVSPTPPGPGRRLAAWGVHLLTASSVPAGILALRATVNGAAATAFLWMAYTLAVDAIDGTLARAVRVKEVLPWGDGSR